MGQFYSLFGGKHTVTSSNGLIHVGNLIFPSELIERDVRPASSKHAIVHEEQFVYLSIHCLCLMQDVPVVAAFAYAQSLLHPQSVLCAEIWSSFSFLFVAPSVVTTALSCERPDIIRTVQLLYGQWLEHCRSPSAIAAALLYISKGTWHFLSNSKSFQILRSTICCAQIAVTFTRSASEADIVIDGRAKLIVSRRDKCLLSLLFCAGPHRDVIGLDEPMFQTVATEFPTAFSEQPPGFSVLDELR